MASIIIRDLDPTIKERFKERAKRNGRSMEAEARVLIEEAVAEENPALAMMRGFQAIDGWEMPVMPVRDDPPRDPFAGSREEEDA